MASSEPERVETVVIGGGQAGLSVGYYLAQRGLPFVILDSNERIGDAWRNRWDSLRLFTPRRFDGLAGKPFPGPSDSFPSKDEVGDYLETFAAQFELPVRTGARVRQLTRNEEGFMVTTGDRRIESHNVVVAMGTHQVPRVPPFASELGASVVQMHSADYRNPSQLQEGGVLVVGVGNSGGEIALEVAREHQTWLAGREVGHVPFRIEGALARYVVLPLLFRFIAQRVLTVDTRIGRRMRPKFLSRGSPLVRVRPKDLTAAGVEAHLQDRRGSRWTPRDGGSRGPLRRRQCGVVHGVPLRLLMDPPARVRRDGAEALPRDRRRGAGPVLRRVAFSLCDVVGVSSWRRERCGVRRRAHRLPGSLSRWSSLLGLPVIGTRKCCSRIERVADRLFEGEEAVLHVMG